MDKKHVLKLLETNASTLFSGRGGISGECVEWYLETKSAYFSALMDVLSKHNYDLSELSVLDIGCSRCDMLLTMKAMGCKDLVGINIEAFKPLWLKNPSSFDKFWGETDGKIKYYICDVDNEKLPFNSNSKSLIIMCDVLEHLHNPSIVLSEISRVLKKNGILLLGTPNIANLRNRIRLFLGKSVYFNLEGWLRTERYKGKFGGHIREYSMEELEHILKSEHMKILKTGFAPSNIEKKLPTSRTLYGIYRVVEKMIPRFAYHMLIIGQK